jgi:hypothetical protein
LFEQQTLEFVKVLDATVNGDPARDIGIGADGSVWILKGGADRDAACGLFRWDGFSWIQSAGKGVALSVAPDGEPWVIDADGRISRRVAGAWEVFPGFANDISVGDDGTAWIVGTNSRPGGFDVCRWNGSAWDCVDGAATRIAVAGDGLPWIINDRGNIFRRLGGRWHQVLGGALDIAAGADGNVWIAGMDGGRHGGYGVHRWNGREWDSIDGAAIRIGVAPNGLPWLVNIRGNVYRRHVQR